MDALFRARGPSDRRREGGRRKVTREPFSASRSSPFPRQSSKRKPFCRSHAIHATPCVRFFFRREGIFGTPCNHSLPLLPFAAGKVIVAIPFRHSACFATLQLPFPRCLSPSSASYISALFIQRIAGALTCRCLAGVRGRTSSCLPSEWPATRAASRKGDADHSRQTKEAALPLRQTPRRISIPASRPLWHCLSVPMVFNSCFSDRHNPLRLSFSLSA